MPLSPDEQVGLRRLERDLGADRRLARRMRALRRRSRPAAMILAIAATDLDAAAVIADARWEPLPAPAAPASG